MARSSFGKLSRDKAKKEKAQAKRERRLAAAEEVVDEPVADRGDSRSTEELLREIEELHRLYDEGALGLDDFEERKADLLGRLSVD